jgi:hypothetical protein
MINDHRFPIDPKLRIGTLSNGLTYYVQSNVKPKRVAELRLVVQIGSLVEVNYFISYLGVLASLGNYETGRARAWIGALC